MRIHDYHFKCMQSLQKTNIFIFIGRVVLSPLLLLDSFRISFSCQRLNFSLCYKLNMAAKGLFCFQFIFLLYFLFVKLLGNKCVFLKTFFTVSLLRQSFKLEDVTNSEERKKSFLSHSLPWKLCSLLVCNAVECPYGMLLCDELICHLSPFCWQSVTLVWEKIR